jgi:hypothetical protein
VQRQDSRGNSCLGHVNLDSAVVLGNKRAASYRDLQCRKICSALWNRDPPAQWGLIPATSDRETMLKLSSMLAFGSSDPLVPQSRSKMTRGKAKAKKERATKGKKKCATKRRRLRRRHICGAIRGWSPESHNDRRTQRPALLI